MHKVMVFIDYQNFFISWKWKNRGRKPPFVDYQKLGRLINRQIPLDSEVIKINDPSTYTTEEKETDINIATHMIAKGFQNAYDIAILVSGDTDYVQVIRTLHDLGKIVVIAHFPEQNIAKYQGMYDAEVILDDDLLHRAGNASYGREKRSRKRYPSRFPSEKK